MGTSWQRCGGVAGVEARPRARGGRAAATAADTPTDCRQDHSRRPAPQLGAACPTGSARVNLGVDLLGNHRRMELPVTDDPSGEMTCRRRFSDSSSKHTMVEPGVSISRIFPVHGARRSRSQWTHSRLHLLRTLRVFGELTCVYRRKEIYFKPLQARSILSNT